MNRSDYLQSLSADRDPLDILVVGGGATGLACALDAVSRGYRVGLVERGDFGEGTSSRSTKLIHGGVRYLRQGHLGLVRESLRERAWFFRAAPHLVHPLEFIIPCRSGLEQAWYRSGMALYDLLAGRSSASVLSRDQVLDRIPGHNPALLHGGVRYLDGQFDDARMIICFLKTFLRRGGVAFNHAPVVALHKEGGRLSGADIEDRETGQQFRIRARVIINATGVYTDRLCSLDDPAAPPRIAASQGIHLVLDGSFLGGTSALMIPRTADGRVLFAVPWHGRVLYGTTDTARPEIEDDPKPLASEIEYLLEHGRNIFAKAPSESDILGTFAGLRPLPRTGKNIKTSAVSRDFHVDVSRSGLVHVYGGKWTTCRAMGKAAVDRAALVGGLPEHSSPTADMVFDGEREPESHLSLPGREWVQYVVRHEMARTLDDLLLRRTRLGVLDPAAARGTAPACARWMAEELGRNMAWAEEQARKFQA